MTKKNDYSWDLDCISHKATGKAHLSKNWTAQKQKEYNAWYYKTHKGEYERADYYEKKWLKKYASAKNEENMYKEKERKAKPGTYTDEFSYRPTGRDDKTVYRDAASFDRMRQDYYKQNWREYADARNQRNHERKYNLKSYLEFGVYDINKTAKETVNKGKKALNKYLSTK